MKIVTAEEIKNILVIKISYNSIFFSSLVLSCYRFYCSQPFSIYRASSRRHFLHIVYSLIFSPCLLTQAQNFLSRDPFLFVRKRRKICWSMNNHSKIRRKNSHQTSPISIIAQHLFNWIFLIMNMRR